MFYSTHMIFANEIYRIIDNELELKLRRTSFLYGNVRPDLSMPGNKKIPHTLKESFLYITNEIEQLIYDITHIRQMRSRDFAKRLGIINHYVADYFCLAHNKDLMDEGLVKHMIYEIGISKLCKKNKKVGKRRNLINDDFIESGCSTIADYILYKHSNYLEEIRSLKVDVNYAVQTCITVTSAIIRECIQKCERKAA